MIENVRQPQLGPPIGLQQPREVQSLGVEPNVVARGGQEEQGSFAGRLGDALREVSAIQMEASKAQEQLVRGEPIDLHEVMIRQEEILSAGSTAGLHNRRAFPWDLWD